MLLYGVCWPLSARQRWRWILFIGWSWGCLGLARGLALGLALWVWRLALGTWHFALGTWHLALGTSWHLALWHCGTLWVGAWVVLGFFGLWTGECHSNLHVTVQRVWNGLTRCHSNTAECASGDIINITTSSNLRQARRSWKFQVPLNILKREVRPI